MQMVASIPLYDSTTWSGWGASDQYNKGTYTSINGTSSGDVTGAIFKVAGSNVKVHNMTYDEAYSLSYAQRNLLGNAYWLASPYTGYRNYVYGVDASGYIGGATYPEGVRPVVSISGVTLSK